MLRTAIIALVLVLAAALIPPAGAQSAASIQIVSPRNRATVSGSQVVIEVRVQNFSLNPMAIGKTAKPGEGHWAVYVDGKFAGLSADDVVSIPNGAYAALPAGKHQVKVELRNNDETPVAGADNSEITVTVPAKSAMRYAPASGQPGIKILVPHDRTSVSAYLIVWVKVRGLKTDGAGQGGWRLYVDGHLAGVSTTNVADVQLGHGKHVLKATLQNHDSTPVTGASSDQVTVTVQ